MANPVKIIQAKNGYILEVTINKEQTEHYVVGSLSQAFESIAKHFNDVDYMNQQLENAKNDESSPSYSN